MDELWDHLLTVKLLKRGWQLARESLRRDFFQDLYSAAVFSSELDRNIQEIIDRLKTETYQPRPLVHVEVAKSSLAIRPGTVVNLQDRTVLCTIMFLLAPEVDKKYPESVYSFRVKNPLPKKASIFKDSSADNLVDHPDLTYLKARTIRRDFDPIEPWYENWPLFDQKSKEAFLENEYKYLATSDIAAYFENIQLPILRDQLLGHFPNDPKIINFLIEILEAWTLKTHSGRSHLRGIPQGNIISSFLGNMFLLPLDDEFTEFEKTYDAKYFRYMDDVRIFTKKKLDARLALLMLDRILRKLHLNIQTAKTKILEEKFQEISTALVDERIDKMKILSEKLKDLGGGDSIKPKRKDEFLAALGEISHESPKNKCDSIVGARKPLSGLTLRSFQMWANLHNSLNSSAYLPRLLKEIRQGNPDNRLTLKLISAAKNFPRHASIETTVLTFLQSGENIFPHQESQYLRAIRYLSRNGEEITQYCESRLSDETADRFIRIEAANLLSRSILDEEAIERYLKMLDSEPEPLVKAALAGLVIQTHDGAREIVQSLMLQPNHSVGALGNLFRNVRNDLRYATGRLDYAFSTHNDSIICDNMAFVHLAANSPLPDIRKLLLKRINKFQCRRVGIREALENIKVRIIANDGAAAD